MTPWHPFLTPSRCLPVVTPNGRRARPPGACPRWLPLLYPTVHPFLSPWKKDACQHPRTGTSASPVHPSAPRRASSVPSICRASCWRPRHRAVSLSLSLAGATRACVHGVAPCIRHVSRRPAHPMRCGRTPFLPRHGPSAPCTGIVL
jgi:hypothetical protein